MAPTPRCLYGLVCAVPILATTVNATIDAWSKFRILEEARIFPVIKSRRQHIAILNIRGGAAISTTMAEPKAQEESNLAEKAEEDDDSMIRYLFSDVDGTLVHYPKSDELSNTSSLIHLPASSTGMRGIISGKTLALCSKLRRDYGIKLTFISGMRTSTLLSRLPFLPKADAYACEGGGRIFYLRHRNDDDGNDDDVSISQAEYDGVFLVKPHPYEDANVDDLMSFEIVEDEEWKEQMIRSDAAGKDGYVGNLLSSTRPNNPSHDSSITTTTTTTTMIPLEDRDDGILWKFARDLVSRGFVLDLRGYATCFRVNRKHQDFTNKLAEEDFDELIESDPPLGLARSVNLGSVDFYPAKSGKKNCCAYLAKKFYETNNDAIDPSIKTSGEQLLQQNAVCMCDDDNDLEMALACRHAFVPSVTSSTMRNAIQNHPNQLTVTGSDTTEAMEATRATEMALEQILLGIHQKSTE